jgi:hypothetical protein
MGCVVKAEPLAAPLAGVCKISWAGAPTVAVAVIVVEISGLLPVIVAERVFNPVVVPRVQLDTVAIPDASVVALAPATDPPPKATANVTFTPATGLLPASRTITLGGVDTEVPTVALCPSPAYTAIWVGVLAVKVTVRGEPF